MQRKDLNILSKRGYLILNKALIAKCGINEALMLSELMCEDIYWTEHNGKNKYGEFFSTVENIKLQTGLSKHLQLMASKHLAEMGLLTSVRRGIPANRYFRLNLIAINNLINYSEVSPSLEEQAIAKSFEEPADFNVYPLEEFAKEAEHKPEKKKRMPKETNEKTSKKQSVVRNYIDSLSLNEEVKNEIRNWYDNVGKGKTTAAQLESKIKDAYEKLGNSDERVKAVIHRAFERGYKGWVFDSDMAQSTNNETKFAPVSESATEIPEFTTVKF